MTTNCLDNHEKFIQLYELYYQDLLRYAISIVKSHSAAEELVHDAYVKILKRIEEHRRARFGPYQTLSGHHRSQYLLRLSAEICSRRGPYRV